ncbi:MULTISPECIES: efflux RND transporter periplasmic adaptor subunit [Halocynthiibacter]|uniref:Efflux RND transporter periplasmic adaptor subunit n=1 Tax=Halocynthiibacter halioticoli TaxID=2986804 RepID=A0AAE3J2E2_9RHOB|nr:MULTISPECIES: efflux RND transporter periplasmic adaptor subunit [Halocynthiibacter]MCV6823982.1 efflux RND transporter periplasmic adaptor subunit [Halocynthiibacter halioticoli]MCW4056983.1 efflux RND transporter periplasmic adaptor subunit [Halocynthiibacter sp. SDUM655004]MDE0589991.1 efflux RND transporter periplasmic adaptor subunit [Halocynthiibacter sp. C4]
MPRTLHPFATLSRAATVAAVFAFVASSSSAQEEPPAPKVGVAAAYTEEIRDEHEFIGRGEAVDKINIVTRVEGFVEEIHVEAGAFVKAGDVLFSIEKDNLAATLEARKADFERAEADLELARIELDRKQTLLDRDAGTVADRDIALANEKVAEANVASAQAAIRIAELNLSYTDIVAPFDGRIGRIEPSIGDLVSPSTGPLTSLVRQAPIYVTFSVSEKQLITVVDDDGMERGENDVPVGLPNVLLKLQNGRILEETGDITFIDNVIDPLTGTIALRAIFDNAERMIIDGGFVTVLLEAVEPESQLLIPMASVQRDQRGPFVLVVTDQSLVEQRYVTLGRQIGAAIIVEDGMREGEVVIIEGLQRVRPGAPVEAVLAASPEE